MSPRSRPIIASLADSVCDIEACAGAGRRGPGGNRLGDRHSAGNRRRIGGNGARVAGFRRAARHIGRFGGRRPARQRIGSRRAVRPSDQGRSKEINPGVDIDDIAALFLDALSEPGITMAQKLQRIGAVAHSTATVSEAVRREVIAQRLPSPRLAGPGAADHRDRHRHRRAGRLRPGIGCRAGRRGRGQLRRAGRVAAGDDRRTALHGRRRGQHHELETGRRLRCCRRAGALRASRCRRRSVATRPSRSTPSVGARWVCSPMTNR